LLKKQPAPMGNISGKRLLLVGFIIILLIAIPVTLLILKQQNDLRSHATASTNLTFLPPSSAAAPIQKNIGDPVALDINVDPGVNLVSFVKLEIQYDPTVLQIDANTGSFQPNTQAFPTTLEGPIYSPGKVAVTLSIGANPTSAIQTVTKAATITFKAINGTPAGQPTQVSYIVDTSNTSTQVLSVGSTDQASENVLSSSTPAFIAIAGGTNVSPTATPSATLTPVPGQPTATPVPGVPAATATPVPQAPPGNVAAPTPTTAPVVQAPPPAAPTATIAPTGSSDMVIGVSAVLTTLSVIGAVIFLAL